MTMENYLIDLIRKYILPGLLFLVVTSCGEETDISGGMAENYRPIDISVKMKVAEYQKREVTKSVETPLPGDMGNAENTISNVTVFQFDGEGNDTDPLVVLRYVDTGFNNLQLGLMQPKSDPNKKQFIYFIANAGEQLQDFTGTYGDLKQKLISANDAGISDGIIVMTTSLVTMVKATQDISVKFSRRMAKINVTCFIAAGVKFTPSRLQLRNVPKSFPVVSSSTLVPTASADNFQNYLSVTDNILSGYTWYMPENRRGTGSANDPKNKTASTAPAGQSDYCTYVELSGLYQENGTSKLVSYRVYLGGDNTKDYNVDDNRIYSVHLSVTGVNEIDQRLTVETLPAAKTPANCYMVSPGATVVIDMLKSPGDAVSASGVDYATRLGGSSDQKIKSVGIVWQTADTPDGLIQDLSYLGVGLTMFKASPSAAGNLLLAAYSEPEQQGTILWSWHIWVTDYDPGTGETTGVSNGKVHDMTATDGGIWMDRDLGALTATPGQATTLGYAYQWGRKDPFPMSNSVSTSVLRPLYDAKGEYLRSGVAVEERNSSSQLIVDKSISEPWIFYTNTITNHGSGYGYWWGGNSINVPLWSDGVKTMYDPCPAGWRLPTGTIAEKMSGSTMQNWSGTIYGAYYRGTSWYQYYGYLLYSTGAMGEVNNTGVYWTSNVRKMYQLNQTHTSLGSGNRDCDYGFIGRCVKHNK